MSKEFECSHFYCSECSEMKNVFDSETGYNYCVGECLCKLYPVVYEGSVYNFEDCSEIFRNCYNSRESLNCDGGVYIGEGLSVFPDGKLEYF